LWIVIGIIIFDEGSLRSRLNGFIVRDLNEVYLPWGIDNRLRSTARRQKRPSNPHKDKKSCGSFGI